MDNRIVISTLNNSRIYIPRENWKGSSSIVQIENLRLIYVDPFNENIPAPEFARDVINGYLGVKPAYQIEVLHPCNPKAEAKLGHAFSHSLIQPIPSNIDTTTAIRIWVIVQIVKDMKTDYTDWIGVQSCTCDMSHFYHASLTHVDFVHLFVQQYGSEMMNLTQQVSPTQAKRLFEVVQSIKKHKEIANSLSV